MLSCNDQATLYAIDMAKAKTVEAKPLSFGARIKLARVKRGKTQSQVGAIFGITYAAVSAWERNDTLPEIDKLMPLSRFLGVPVAYLLEGEGLPPDSDELDDLINSLTPAQRRQAIRLWRAMVAS